MLYYLGYSLVNTPLQIHWIGTCCDILQSFVYDSLCKDRSSRRTVTGIVTGLAGNTLDELCACILEIVFQFHFLCNGHTVLGNLWGTEFLSDNDIASFRTKRYLDCVCQLVYPAFQKFACICIEFYFFCHDCKCCLLNFMICFFLIVLKARESQ